MKTGKFNRKYTEKHLQAIYTHVVYFYPVRRNLSEVSVALFSCDRQTYDVIDCDVIIQANAIGTEFETAFEMSASNIRYGPGVTREVGMDFKNLKAKRVLLMTDKNLSKLPPVQQAMESLDAAGVNFELYDQVVIGQRSFLKFKMTFFC